MILGYVVDGNTVAEGDARRLTHIHCAFGYLTKEGELSVEKLNMLGQISLWRQWNPELKVVLSAAAGEPGAFSFCAGRAELRKKTAASLKKAVEQYGFDGIDLDWEYPCVPTTNGGVAFPEDRKNFTLLCRAIREALPEGKSLSIASGADEFYLRCVEPEALAGVLSYVCVMTYDLRCQFHALTGHHTGLFPAVGDLFYNSCSRALRLFEEAGFKRGQLLLGTGFYSRKWENVPDKNHGFLQATASGGGYGPIYRDLVPLAAGKDGFVRYWDEEAKAPWLFDGSTFLSYEDGQSVRFKAEYVKAEGYGGIFYWEHRCDPSGELLGIMAEVLK